MDTCRAGEVFQAIVNIVEISEEKLLEIVTNNSSRLLFSQPLQPANDPFWEYSVLFNNTNVKRREIDELESNSSLLSSLVTRLYYMERWKEKLTHQPEETKVLDLEVSHKDAVEDNLGYFPTQYTHIQVQPEKLIPVILIREPSKTNIFIPTKKSYSTRPGSNNTISSISVIKDINKKYSLPRGYADSCAKPASSGGLGYANSNNIYTQQQSPVSATPRSLFMLPGINESKLIERFSPLKALSIKSFISNYLSFGTPPTGASDFENANDTTQQQDRKQETKKSCSTSQTVDTNPSQLQATNGGSTSPTKLLFGENVELVQCFIYPYSDEYLLILLKPSFSQEKLDDDKYLCDSEQDQKYFVLYVFNTLDLFLLSKQQYSMPQSPTKAGTNFNEVGIYSALACISPTPKTHLSIRPKATTTTLPNLDCTAKYLPLYRKLKQTIARLGPSSSQPDFQCVNLWFKDSVDFEKTLDWVSKFKNHQRTTNPILKAVCGPG
ncbi:hypothetical protein AX774_g3950 [Zancudomyces culisetae]|uniref:Uncharacterized protein n=1 Tax=Zancudomyces culisetae TaxID=1213189 RepID=A0A1R1PNV0_ZANCU|nr:hypothetical protein AX774_g3950 [Zancudomyces culisetae]|eukprot:OMH82562.1 hypothetical protein AX774_g3950 [Zancudomyces culisetae]